MAVILLETHIRNRVSVCFDLSRDLNLHMHSMQHTNEQVVAGVKTGLLELNQQVTWRARHLGIYHRMTVVITEMDAPFSFKDVMVRGPFKRMEHTHIFIACGEYTVMQDMFEFEAPLGIIGKLAEWLFLKKYMKDLLKQRNWVIKQQAEGNIDIMTVKN